MRWCGRRRAPPTRMRLVSVHLPCDDRYPSAAHAQTAGGCGRNPGRTGRRVSFGLGCAASQRRSCAIITHADRPAESSPHARRDISLSHSLSHSLSLPPSLPLSRPAESSPHAPVRQRPPPSARARAPKLHPHAQRPALLEGMRQSRAAVPGPSSAALEGSRAARPPAAARRRLGPGRAGASRVGAVLGRAILGSSYWAARDARHSTL